MYKYIILILSIFLVNWKSYSQELIPIEINQNSIIFNSNAGEIQSLSYGITPGLELGTVNSDTLSGLNKASFYYVKAKINTSETAVNLYSTKSNSSGSINVFFNHKPNNTLSESGNAKYGNFEELIVGLIDSTEFTLDICVFYTKNKTIGGAINRAFERGVVVRFIAGDSKLGDFPKNLKDDISTLKREEPKGQMHHKFIISDVENENLCKVLITSANFTDNNLFEDSNNLLIIQDQTMAKNYTIEFNEMWGGESSSPTSASKFGTDKTDNTSHYFNIGGSKVEVYFSPSDQVEYHIDQKLNTANSDLGFALFTFTNDKFSESLINLHNQGVNIYGIIDNKRYYGSKDNDLANAGISILKFNRKDDMHNKYAVIDALDSLSDPFVVTGSYNWSKSAEKKYDENAIIIYNSKIANEYYEDINTFTNFGYEKSLLEDLRIYPNPSCSSFKFSNITKELPSSINLTIIDLTGKVVYNNTVNILDQIEVTNLSIGIYFIKVQTEHNFAVKKLIRN